MTRLQTAALALAVAIPIGGLGAWAFNPDNGAVLHSLVRWRIFGITFELGLPLLLVLAILIAIRGLLTARHSRHTT